MKSLLESINESLIMESNDLWKQYTYCMKNMPNKVPFKDKDKVTEEDLVLHYQKYLKNDNISYDDLTGIALIGFEEYVTTNWDNLRLLDMKFSYNHSTHKTTLVIEYGPKDTPRKSKGTVAKDESTDYNLKDGEDKNVSAKDWVHAIVTFFEENIKE